MDTKQAGSMGGHKRMDNLSKQARTDLALKACSKRWNKSYQALGTNSDDMPQFDKCGTCGRMRYKHVYKPGEVGYHEFIPS